MEQIKILEIINQWGYLDTYQISLLLKKISKNYRYIIKDFKNKKINFS